MAVGLPMKTLLLRDEPFVALCPVLTRGPYNLSIQCWTFETPTAKVAEATFDLLLPEILRFIGPGRGLEGATNVGFQAASIYSSN